MNKIIPRPLFGILVYIVELFEDFHFNIWFIKGNIFFLLSLKTRRRQGNSQSKQPISSHYICSLDSLFFHHVANSN